MKYDEDIVENARRNGKITDYEKFCETEISNEYKLSDDEIKYYTSLNDEKMDK